MNGWIWRCIHLTVLLILANLSPQIFVFADEEFSEIGLDGTKVRSDSQKRQSGGDRMAVQFHNGYADKAIYLFWLNQDDGNNVFMNQIPARSSIPLTTTPYHIFFASSNRAGSDRLVPFQHSIDPDVDEYLFAPAGQDLGHVRPPSVSMPSMPSQRSAAITKNPYVKVLNQPTTAVSAKFRSMIPGTINIWYEDGRGGSFQGTLGLGKEYTINTYVGHVFFFTDMKDKTKEYGRFVMKADQVLYVIRDPTQEPPAHLLEHQEREEAFMEEYRNRTGIDWRHYFGPQGPRAPPTLHMWPANEVGDIHSIECKEGYWHCEGDAKTCQSKEPITFNMEVISTAPKAFIIPNFLNEFEADGIRSIAEPLMAASTVGNRDGGGTRASETRTSRNAWVGRSVNYVTETLFRRAEQLLKVPRLDRTNTEDMQVVHYVNGQKYDSHHDWGVSGYSESRYITLLLYLTDMASPGAGGETSFPKAAGGRGIKVHPGKGSAVLFYNLLEDGNGDDLSLHAALPVREGEKWLANFWVWDPKRR